MNNPQKRKLFFSKSQLIVAGILLSGLCWYLSEGLSGDYWYLLWIAPIPAMLIAFQVSARQAFAFSFLAYLIGRLSWVSYLLAVLPVVPVILFTIISPLVFAGIMLLVRRVVLANPRSLSALAFPVLWSSFEFLVSRFSIDGTMGSIAYTQSNFIPIIQVASVTGILGITFLTTLLPSAVAVAWYYRREKRIVSSVSITVSAIILLSVVFGTIRMKGYSSQNEMTVGLGVIDERLHIDIDHFKPIDELRVANLYVDQIPVLAKQGARVVVFPEKIFNTAPEMDSSITAVFIRAAISNHIAIVTGYTRFIHGKKENMALVISREGKVLADYRKVNLFELEKIFGFIPGKGPGLFTLENIPSGIAICKDLDYQSFMRKYIENNAEVLYVPAWDFVKDGWLHSRMAVLRGVENGYAVIRSARLGRLTISDYTGNVSGEASSENGKGIVLTGKISLQKRNTIYSRFGDWFGVINLIAAACFILFTRKRKKMVSRVIS